MDHDNHEILESRVQSRENNEWSSKMERYERFFLAEWIALIFPASILPTASFWDWIIGIRIDDAAEEGLEPRSRIKNNYGYDIVLLAARVWEEA